MSETAWSPGGVVEGADPAEGGASDRRRVLLVGGLALAALAGVGVLLLNGPDDTVLEQAAAPPAAAAPAPDPSPSAVSTAVPQTAQARSGRNPFLDPAPPAAVAVQPVGGGGVTPAPTVDGALPVDAPLPVAPALPGTQPVQGGAPGVPPATTEPVSPATTLVLLRVAGSGDSRTGVFRVGSAQVTARVGDSFGGAAGLLLLSLQEGPEQGQWTAVVQSGLGDPFDVVTGVPVPLT